MRKFSIPKSDKFDIKKWQDKNLVEASYDYKNDKNFDEDQVEQIDAADDIHPKDFKKFRGEWDGDAWAVLAKQGYKFVDLDKKIGKYLEGLNIGDFDSSGYGFTGQHTFQNLDGAFVVHQVAKIKGGDPYLFVVDGNSGKATSAKAGQIKKVGQMLALKYAPEPGA